MKHIATYLLVIVTVCALTACKHHPTDTEGLTDAEKLEVLDFKLEKHPKDHALLYERSMVFLNLGRAKEALTDINRAVELEGDNLEYRLRQADIYFANGDVENSYKSLSEAERISPDSKEVQLKMGEVMFYSRDFDRAIKCLTKVTEQEPDNQTALVMKGFIYKEKGDTASAVTLLRKVCDLYPDYAPAFEELGVLYSTRNNPMAVEYLSTAIQLEPNNTNALYALAMFYQQNEEMDKAEELYRRILDINENSADAWHNLGYIEMMHYLDFERAIEYFDRALQADPSHSAAAQNRQLAYELQNI